jgi:hypothetical protein
MGHHRFFGLLDLNNPITFEGIITNVQFVNPHISFNVDVKDSAGKVTNWRFEGANVGALRMRGWDRNDLRVGDKVTVTGYRTKDGSRVAGASAVTLADGRTLDAASDGVPSYIPKKQAK